MLMPSLQKALATATRTVCTNNLRSVNFASFQMYSNDYNNDLFVPDYNALYSGTVPSGGYEMQTFGAGMVYLGYLTPSKALYCPNYDKIAKGQKSQVWIYEDEGAMKSFYSGWPGGDKLYYNFEAYSTYSYNTCRNDPINSTEPESRRQAGLIKAYNHNGTPGGKSAKLHQVQTDTITVFDEYMEFTSLKVFWGYVIENNPRTTKNITLYYHENESVPVGIIDGSIKILTYGDLLTDDKYGTVNGINDENFSDYGAYNFALNNNQDAATAWHWGR